MIAAGLLALVGGLVAGIVIIIKNKDGSERKIDVPDGSEVVIKQTDRDKKTDKVENPPTGADGKRLFARWEADAGQ